MNWLQTLRIALRALGLNKMRSFLTVLGVVIGVAAVVAMVGIGEGAKARVEASFASMGTNMLVINSGSSRSGGSRGGFGSQPTITWDDLTAIRQEVPSVRFASASLRTSSTIASEDQNWTTSVYGVSPDFFDIRSWEMAQGARFSEADVEGGAKVVILGKTVVDQIFGPDAEVVGRTLRVGSQPFLVVGVLASKGQTATGQDNDDAAYVPQTTFQSKLQGGLQKYLTGSIMVSTGSGQTQSTLEQITTLLRERHRLSPEEADDFSIRDLTAMAAASQEGTQTMSLLLSSIAAVSLLVGGIGIMNIMLVSVTERTREIGLRMALGAKPSHILAQFLVEATVLSVLGGLLGVALGAGIAGYLASQFGWSVVVRPDIVAVSLLFSGLVGVGFGLYPAQKASKLDPIEALRFE
jgi:putative ABC transport system permease protein